MTTETKPRTLEEIHNRWCLLDGCMEMAEPSCVVARVIRETVALGSASRASPEAPCAGCGGCGDGRSWADVERVLNDLDVSQDPAVRGVVQMIRARLPRPGCPGGHLSSCAVHNEPAFPNGPCDCGRASPEEGRAVERLREGVEVMEAVAALPPERIGAREYGHMRDWLACARAALRSPPAPSEDTRRCADCGIEAEVHALHRQSHPFRAPPPEDSGARRCNHPNWIECDSTCRAPASSKEGGR